MGVPYREYELPALHLQYAEAEPDDQVTAQPQVTSPQALFRDQAAVRRWLWTMPLMSAQELAITTGLSLDRIYKVLKNLRRRGLATRASLGRAGGVRERWWLTTLGVLRTAEELGRPIPWQVTETGLRWLVRRLPAIEAFYAFAPQVWSRPDVLTPHETFLTPDPDEDPTVFTEDLQMIEFEWIRDGEIHAVAHYTNGSWLPMIWVGSMVSATVIKRKGEAARGQLRDGLNPAGWVIVCDDGLAAKQAADLWPESNALVSVHGAPALRKMRPSAFSQRILRGADDSSPLGKPEAIVVWLQQDAGMLALNGASSYTLFRFIAEWPGATPRQIETGFGRGYRAILRPLRLAGLVVRLDGGYYLDRAGILAVAHMDRISWQSVQSRLEVYLKDDGVYRRNQQRHNRSIVDVVLTLYRRGAFPYGGWRAVHNIPNVTQVVPDVVALVTRDDGQSDELFIEVEFTAVTPARIEAKLKPYRLVLQHTGDHIQCLFLVEDARTRQRYASAGVGLINVLTLREFLTGEWD